MVLVSPVLWNSVGFAAWKMSGGLPRPTAGSRPAWELRDSSVLWLRCQIGRAGNRVSGLNVGFLCRNNGLTAANCANQQENLGEAPRRILADGTGLGIIQVGVDGVQNIE
jgi:hypothetical protein